MISFARVRRNGTLISDEEALLDEPIAPITSEQVETAVRQGLDNPDTLDKLPSPNVKRWTAQRKTAVVIAVSDGRINREEACRRYQLSEEEFLAWEDTFRTHGSSGLRATYLREYRPSRREPTG